MLGGIGQWLTEKIAASRVRELPPVLLSQQMTSLITFHFVLRPAMNQVPQAELPTMEETFTQNFLRAVPLV
ncbi:hypothetical protein C6Y14_43260 [Streptomyces dioscori]|uniref:Tetracyclin repressor-like C-terminal domain-containing protein n=2 Tax=Streptomyces dioscori TaxID=2109333 RepID=A0A2P8PTF4_9ACTN|nr:hypothetical protein C6Y14_43260 [Streptomyces dioscori]